MDINTQWDKEALLKATAFEPLHPVIARLHSGHFPTLPECNALLLAHEPNINVHNGTALIFVPQEYGKLEFEAPDFARFPALSIAYQALKSGGNAPCVLNAANEVAVRRFLAGKIGFLDIAKTVEKTLALVHTKPLITIDDVLACDAEARKIAQQ